MAVEAASAAPCQARSLMSVSTRRCDSIANAISKRNAASTFTSSARIVIPTSAFHQEMSQHAEHGEQERGGQELRREEEALLAKLRLFLAPEFLSTAFLLAVHRNSGARKRRSFASSASISA